MIACYCKKSFILHLILLASSLLLLVSLCCGCQLTPVNLSSQESFLLRYVVVVSTACYLIIIMMLDSERWLHTWRSFSVGIRVYCYFYRCVCSMRLACHIQSPIVVAVNAGDDHADDDNITWCLWRRRWWWICRNQESRRQVSACLAINAIFRTFSLPSDSSLTLLSHRIPDSMMIPFFCCRKNSFTSLIAIPFMIISRNPFDNVCLWRLFLSLLLPSNHHGHEK